MKHISSVSRKPALAEQDPSDLTSLISVMQFVLSLLTAFTSGANTVFTGVVTALSAKSATKAGADTQ